MGFYSGTKAYLDARQEIDGTVVWMEEELEFLRASGHEIIGAKVVGKK